MSFEFEDHSSSKGVGVLSTNYVFKRQDLYESCDIKYRLFLNALELLTGHLLTGSTTRSVYHLHGRVRSHVIVKVIRICAFSRRDLNLFKRVTSCTPGIMPIHLKCFLKRGLEVFQLLFSRCALRAHATNFFDPSDPEITISLDYCSIFVHVDHDTTNMHESITYEYGRLRYTW